MSKKSDRAHKRQIEKDYYDRNREAILARKKKRFQENACNVREKSRENSREWRRLHAEEINAKARKKNQEQQRISGRMGFSWFVGLWFVWGSVNKTGPWIVPQARLVIGAYQQFLAGNKLRWP